MSETSLSNDEIRAQVVAWLDDHWDPDLLVDECVGFQPDPSVAAFAVRLDLSLHAFDDAGANAVRSHQQIAVGQFS